MPTWESIASEAAAPMPVVRTVRIQNRAVTAGTLRTNSWLGLDREPVWLVSLLVVVISSPWTRNIAVGVDQASSTVDAALWSW
jgi:hypothetical protein